MYRKIIAMLLALAMMFSLAACSKTDPNDPYGIVPESTKGKDVTRSQHADNVFSLNCNVDYSFNPIIATNRSNQLVCSLVYENMVELDNNFNVVANVLDEGTPNENATYWTFKINEGHYFHDGTPVTGKDIRYSLDRAINSDRFRGRFASYQGSGYDEKNFYVTIGIGDTQFNKLLNIPIVQYGTMEDDHPGGSGPYKYNADFTALNAHELYHGYETLPLKTIYLVEYSTADSIISAFEDGIIDAVANDPSSYTNLGYASTNEIRNFNTTHYHYVMFNEDPTANTMGKYIGFRQAMVYAFDRVNFAETLMQDNAVASSVPMHPAAADYPAEYAHNFNYNLERVKTVLENSGIKDYDEDGWLEYMSGSAQDFEVVFIVCSDSSAKTGVVRKFQSDMESIGLRVDVQELTWANYLLALEEGNFDMYYGEVKLRNNFDITELLDVDSELNFSRSRDTAFVQYINNYLASSDSQRRALFQQLCDYINNTGSLISIGFESQQLIVHRGVVKGLDPNIGNPLYNFENWEIMID